MVEFQPFKGFIPNLAEGEEIDSRISPPYDIIDEGEKRALKENPYNVTKITLGAEGGRYKGATKELERWIEGSKLVQDDQESFYIYRQSFESEGKRYTRTGIIGLLRLESYEEGNIIPHEETIPGVKEDRLTLLRDTQTHAESIFGIYERDTLDMGRVIDKSEKMFECEMRGIEHSIFRVSDPGLVQSIEDMMRDKRILIADGHHRFETALRYSEEYPGDEKKSYVLATMVSSDDHGMLVLPTHRLVRDMGIEEGRLTEGLNDFFEVKDGVTMDNMKAVLERMNRKGFGFLTKAGSSGVARLLNRPEGVLWNVDAYVCQEILFKRILKRSPGEDLNVEYDEDIESVMHKMEERRFDLAVLLPSPKLEDIWAVARAGEKMPKKSTFFYPKIWSGFVYYRMS